MTFGRTDLMRTNATPVFTAVRHSVPCARTLTGKMTKAAGPRHRHLLALATLVALLVPPWHEARAAAGVPAATVDVSYHFDFNQPTLGISSISFWTLNREGSWGYSIPADATSYTLADHYPWGFGQYGNLPAQVRMWGITTDAQGIEHLVTGMSSAGAAVLQGRPYPFNEVYSEEQAIFWIKQVSKGYADDLTSTLPAMWKLSEAPPQVWNYTPTPCPPIAPPYATCSLATPVDVPSLWVPIANPGAGSTSTSTFALLQYSTGTLIGSGTIVATSTVPEPATLSLTLSGLALMAGMCRRTRRKSTLSNEGFVALAPSKDPSPPSQNARSTR